MISTDAAVDTCATWTREPVCRASWTSRATIDVLGDRRPGRQPEPTGDLALVAAGRPVGEPGVLGVLGDGAAERLDVVQGPTHEAGVVDALAVVGEDPHPGPRAGHQPELGELGASQPLGHGADRLHVDQPDRPTEVEHPLGRLGRVGHRGGVGHREDRGETTRGRSGRAARDGLGVLATGLAQVGMEVDQARQQDEPGSVDDGELSPAQLARTGDRPDLGDNAVADEDVSALVSQQVCALEQEVGHAAASVSPARR
jgi:hypothetical protein